MNWEFQNTSKKAMKRDPMEAEFFIGDGSGEKDTGKTDSLVRETVQNCLDARLVPGKPVEVRFRIFRDDKALDSAEAEKYFKGLRPHLEALGLADEALPQNAKLDYLLIEDFNTTGLTGDVGRSSDPDPGSANGHPEAFYWFWRNIGRSGKIAETLGRWGLGKTVLPASSKMSSFLGVTKRAESKGKYLMGLSVLKIHQVKGKEFSPEGFFCDPAVSSDLQMPYEDEAVIEKLSKDFNLQRGADSGLSIIVPNPLPEITGLRILRSVIFNFHVRILRDELVVKIEDESSSFEVSKTTIGDVDKLVDWSELPNAAAKRKKPNLQFIEQALSAEPILLPVVGTAATAAKWSKDTLGGSEACSRFYEQLESDEIVRFRLPVLLQHKIKGIIETSFDLALQWKPEATEGFECAVREGMTITKVESGIRKRNLYALTLVDDKPLSDFLCDAEGPAHTEWKSSEKRPNASYEGWVSRLSFIGKAPLRCWDLLQPVFEEEDRVAFKEFFPHIRPGKPLPRKRKGKGKGSPKGHDGPVVDVPVPTPKSFRIESGSPGEVFVKAEDHFNGVCDLKVAVSVLIGEASTWSPYDFDFGSPSTTIDFDYDNASVVQVADNLIDIKEATAGFYMRVKGFDANFDLSFDLKEYHEEEN